MRVDLPDGQWADMRERITHGQDKDIKRARVRVEANPESLVDWPTVIVRAFVREWNVRDPDGNPIPLGDPDAIDRAPDDIVDTLFGKAVDAYKAATVPNAPTPPSSDA